MSKVQQAKNIILNLLNDGKVHTAEEIHSLALECSIISPSNTSAIRNAIYQLKQEYPGTFNCPSKGHYKLETPEQFSTKTGNTNLFNISLIHINNRIKELEHFNWGTCPDNELTIARSQIAELLKLADNIKKMNF